MIVFTRVDDRLIHGQVVHCWLPVLEATVIVVANDQIYQDCLQRSILELAVPESYKVVIESTHCITQVINQRKFDNERLFILFSRI